MPVRTHISRANGMSDCVYIGRPSPLGNPFVIGKDGTRQEVVAKYREWIRKQPQLRDRILNLRNKVLVCYCWADQECHGDVLIEYFNELTAN